MAVSPSVAMPISSLIVCRSDSDSLAVFPAPGVEPVLADKLQEA